MHHEKKLDYQKLYDDTLSLEYQGYISALTKLLEADDGKARSNKLNDYRNSLIEERNKLTRVKVSDSSYNVDAYILKLIDEFSHREYEFDRDEIKLFCEVSIPRIKNDFKTRQKEIVKPEIYKLNGEKTLVFLARYYAIEKFLWDTSTLTIRKSDTVEKIIANITSTKKTKPLARVTKTEEHVITSRQVLAMHFIFEALEVEEKRTLSARARLIQMLTSRSFDNIKKDLGLVLKRKTMRNNREDLRYVHKFFRDLGQDAISTRIKKEIDLLDAPEK